MSSAVATGSFTGGGGRAGALGGDAGSGTSFVSALVGRSVSFAGVEFRSGLVREWFEPARPYLPGPGRGRITAAASILLRSLSIRFPNREDEPRRLEAFGPDQQSDSARSGKVAVENLAFPLSHLRRASGVRNKPANSL